MYNYLLCESYYMNLLEETISSMVMIRKAPNDVKFVSFMDDDYEIYQISFSSL